MPVSGQAVLRVTLLLIVSLAWLRLTRKLLQHQTSQDL